MMGFKEWFLLSEGYSRERMEMLYRLKKPWASKAEVEGAINAAVNADPSPEKKYVRWIFKQVQKGGVKLPEDNGNLSQALNWFDQNRRTMRSRGLTSDIRRYDAHKLFDAFNNHSGQGRMRPNMPVPEEPWRPEMQPASTPPQLPPRPQPPQPMPTPPEAPLPAAVDPYAWMGRPSL